jgi:alpha-tubulin suppressor-like RCC1 family protein
MQQVNSAIAAGTWAVPPAPKLYAWGYNGDGVLGLGNRTNYSSPKQVGALTTWLNIAGGNYQTIAVKTDGTLWSWGSNGYGQLGLGNTTPYSSPKQVGSLTNWASVTTNIQTCLAIKTNGTIWAWGQNDQGQLGYGVQYTAVNSPTQIGSLTNWSKVAGGRNFNIAVKTDGTLWSWGWNASGQLGLGDSGNYALRLSPNQVGALTTWITVAAGTYSSYAVKTDGTLWAWGSNFGGQLGIGNTTYYSSPKQVGALTTWSTVAGGDYSSYAIKTDGTMWVWGKNNDYGQLGLGNMTNYSSPKQLGASTTWSVVNANKNSVLAIDSSRLYAWGRNNSGQLGLGNTTNYSSPKQVGALTSWVNIYFNGQVGSALGIAIT